MYFAKEGLFFNFFLGGGRGWESLFSEFYDMSLVLRRIMTLYHES